MQPHLPVPAVLPVTLGAGGERRTQAVAPGLAQAWLCTDSMLGAPSIVSQGPTPPFPIARTPSGFRVKDPGPPAEPALHPHPLIPQAPRVRVRTGSPSPLPARLTGCQQLREAGVVAPGSGSGAGSGRGHGAGAGLPPSGGRGRGLASGPRTLGYREVRPKAGLRIAGG